jgi:hypothetical protein
MSGYPQIGTFASLDMPSTMTAIRLEARRNGVFISGGQGRKAKKLDPSNLCHRIKRGEAQRHAMRIVYEQARKRSLLLDRTDPDRDIYEVILNNWERDIHILLDHKQHAHLRALVSMERARGQVRTAITAKRAGINL